MKTRTLRLHIHAYDDEHWMIAAIEDTYDRGQLRNSDLIHCDPCERDEVDELVAYYARRMIAAEIGRLQMTG